MNTENLIPVEGHDGWFRDPETNSIVNCNTSDYDEYMARWDARQSKKEKDKALQADVSVLKSEMGDIKDLLQLLLKKS